MMTFIRENSIQQITRLFQRHPDGALGLVGQTKDIKNRFGCYNSYDAVYRQHYAKPFMEYDEFVLFRTWRKYDVLLFEYFLQYHLIQENGEFFSIFGHRMNSQTIRRPRPNEDDEEKRPFYVYLKFTREPFSLANLQNRSDINPLNQDEDISEREDQDVSAELEC